METCIFADDEAGRKFASLLARKSKEGVTVKVIYDSFGSMESEWQRKAIWSKFTEKLSWTIEYWL